MSDNITALVGKVQCLRGRSRHHSCSNTHPKKNHCFPTSLSQLISSVSGGGNRCIPKFPFGPSPAAFLSWTVGGTDRARGKSMRSERGRVVPKREKKREGSEWRRRWRRQGRGKEGGYVFSEGYVERARDRRRDFCLDRVFVKRKQCETEIFW